MLWEDSKGCKMLNNKTKKDTFEGCINLQFALSAALIDILPSLKSIQRMPNLVRPFTSMFDAMMV